MKKKQTRWINEEKTQTKQQKNVEKGQRETGIYVHKCRKWTKRNRNRTENMYLDMKKQSPVF
jgi:hypothetical protein